ncbi:unnamed protein product [Urochloa decumbens]|uniref:Uncharacterized protein n=1 Tax=Urochloa decumbens TaxID=240449 RepID=A0ABC8ZVI2_9POAL
MEDLQVRVAESSFVAPSEPTPRKGLWLSSLDLLMAKRGHTPTFYLFHHNDAASDFFDVARLKAAMAKALVPFYPLAGRLGVDNSGRMEIDSVAEAEERQLVPRIEPSSVVLAVQVTFFRCGGVALGTALHHVSIDAMSAFHFFETWSTFSRDGDRAAVELPCHDRTLLRARSPPTVDPDALFMFHPNFALTDPSGPITSKVFPISKDQVASLKRLCGGASTFCAVSALLWRCTLMPHLPERYFGNALVRVGVAIAVRDIIASEALSSVAGHIGGAIRRIDDEMVRSAVDYVEAMEMSGDQWAGTRPETELQVTSWLGMPIYDADFGWGKPRVMSSANNSLGGSVHLMSGPADGVRVLMSMEAANVKELGRLLYEALARC